MIHAVIFNLDGVLVSSDQCHFQAWKRLAYEQGINLQPDLYLKMVGLKRMDSLRILLKKGERAYTPQEMWALSVRKNDLFNQLIDRLTEDSVLPGTAETVLRLRDMGVKIAVASSSENATGILRHLLMDGWFGAIVDGCQIENGKPDTEAYIVAARKLGMPTNECLVVENTPAGVEGAHQAGMRCLVLGNPYEEMKHDPGLADLPKTLAEIDLPGLILRENRQTTLEGAFSAV